MLSLLVHCPLVRSKGIVYYIIRCKNPVVFFALIVINVTFAIENMESLKEKTAKGLFWGGMSNGVQQLVGLVFGIVLGRLLSPSDYGMIAMITVFSLIAVALQNSGFTAALANLKHPKHEDYNSVFWFNVFMGAGLYALLFLSAPLIAAYYHKPALVWLCRYAFLSILFSCLGTAQAAYLFKNLNTKQQAKTGMTAVLLSSVVGAGMAWMGFSYWSIATQTIVFTATNTLLLWHYSSWRPTRHIDFTPIRKMFRFSCKILATTITTHINNNILNILLGRYFSAHDTGNYNQAYQWDFKCFSLVQGMVNIVAQPVLVDLNGEQDRQLQAFRKMMRFTAFISFPLLFGLGLVAEEFIVLALTEKWLVSAHLLQILCISGAVMPLCTLLSNMIISKGRSNIFFGCTFSLGVIQIVLMLLIWPLGIRTMVMAYTALNLLWLFVWHEFTRRLTGYGLFPFLKDTLPFAFAALGVMVLTGLLTRSIHSLPLLLAVRIFLSALLYYGVMRLARVKILDECTAFILQKIRKQ